MTYPLVIKYIKCGNGQCSTNGGVPTCEYQLFFNSGFSSKPRTGSPERITGQPAGLLTGRPPPTLKFHFHAWPRITDLRRKDVENRGKPWGKTWSNA